MGIVLCALLNFPIRKAAEHKDHTSVVQHSSLAPASYMKFISLFLAWTKKGPRQETIWVLWKFSVCDCHWEQHRATAWNALLYTSLLAVNRSTICNKHDYLNGLMIHATRSLQLNILGGCDVYISLTCSTPYRTQNLSVVLVNQRAAGFLGRPALTFGPISDFIVALVY